MTCGPFHKCIEKEPCATEKHAVDRAASQENAQKMHRKAPCPNSFVDSLRSCAADPLLAWFDLEPLPWGEASREMLRSDCVFRAPGRAPRGGRSSRGAYLPLVRRSTSSAFSAVTKSTTGPFARQNCGVACPASLSSTSSLRFQRSTRIA